MILTDLMKKLDAEISGTHYFTEAAKDAVYPYKVIDFSSTIYGEDFDILSMTLDYWTNGKSIVGLLTSADTDRTALDRQIWELDSGTVKTEYDSLRIVPDDDKNIRHVRVSYTIKQFIKSEVNQNAREELNSDTD